MKIQNIIYPLVLLYSASGCQSFLDIKPDKKMTIPSSVSDCELLLNDYSTMNANYPALGEVSSDDYYLDQENWMSLTEMDERHAYIWADEIMTLQSHWRGPYQVVYRSNQILQVLDKLPPTEKHTEAFRKVKGGALFFRAFAFHQIAITYTLGYDQATASQELGIPLRLSADLDDVSIRSTTEETYDRIVSDLKSSVSYLPRTESLIGRPDQAAAYAALARVYLDMSEYELAGMYADSALQIKNDLLAFDDLDALSGLPVPRFNQEVLFPATSIMADALGSYYSRVNPALYALYEDEDLRKTVFFQENSFAPGTYAYKGSFDNNSGTAFAGITVGEVYLIKAEVSARRGDAAEAQFALNRLLMNRISSDSFKPIRIESTDALLQIVLQERRKELVYRGIRWMDLKRLNRDARFEQTLIRNIGGQEYKLLPNSLKYAIRIPEVVILESGIPQNIR